MLLASYIYIYIYPHIYEDSEQPKPAKPLHPFMIFGVDAGVIFLFVCVDSCWVHTTESLFTVFAGSWWIHPETNHFLLLLLILAGSNKNE